jgi:hypothetical protein
MNVWVNSYMHWLQRKTEKQVIVNLEEDIQGLLVALFNIHFCFLSSSISVDFLPLVRGGEGFYAFFKTLT